MKSVMTRIASLGLAICMSTTMSGAAFAANGEAVSTADPEQIEETVPETSSSDTPENEPSEKSSDPFTETASEPNWQPADSDLVISFDDVAVTYWGYNDVTECAKLGIVAGFEDGTFKPENQVTSVQLLTMLTRTFYASKLDQVTAPKGSAWYYANTKVAADVGMSTGMKAIDDKPINRYEMAVVLNNVLAANRNALLYNERAKAQSAITDYQSIPTNYRTPVLNSYAKGIITGMSDGSFCGAQNMTRAQACTVIMRMLKLINNYNPGDKDNNQYDDGKTQDTGNTGNNQNTSTGTGKLTNGKDATVANVTAMLNDLQRKWPTGTIWTYQGTPGNHYYADGDKTNDVKTLKNQVGNPLGNASLVYGCGGFAAMISNEIFGMTGAPCRELSSPKDMRPGDILATFDKNGNVTHVCIVMYTEAPYQSNGKTMYPIVTADGNISKEILWGLSSDIVAGFGSSANPGYGYARCYTRYPE